MKLNDLDGVLVSLYMASVAPEGPSVKLRSPPGRGKSSMLRTLKRKLAKHFPGKKFGMVVRNGASITLTSATGYLWPKDRDGTQYSEFTRPEWWLTDDDKLPLEFYDGGVIVIDEDDKLGPDEKKLFGEAALSKVLGNHKLPPGWVVWFAGNYASNRSGSTREYDHLITRQITIHIKDDLRSLLDWMDASGILPEVKVFAEENPQWVFQEQPKEQGPYCTPRGTAQADLLLRTLMTYHETDVIPTDPLTLEMIEGGIGAGAASALFASIRLGQELPPYATIVSNPTKTPVPTRPDVKRMACYKLGAQVSVSDMEHVLTYVKRLPEEFQFIFGKSAVLRNPSFVVNKHYSAWAAGKSQLLELMMKLK